MPLSDLAAIPLFVALRYIWFLGLHCSLANAYGYAFVGRSFFKPHLTLLTKWMAEQVAGRARIDHAD